MNTVPTISLDYFQAQLDKLMLTIFESVRKSDSGISSDDSAAEVIEIYRDLVHSIDNLVGINNTKEDQEKILNENSIKYLESKNKVINYKSSLTILNDKIDDELMQVKCLRLLPTITVY
jgi:hypothetical protein